MESFSSPSNAPSSSFNTMVHDVERFLSSLKKDPYHLNRGAMPVWSFDPWNLEECNQNSIYSEFLFNTKLHVFEVMAYRWVRIFENIGTKSKANLLEATDQVVKEMNE